MDIVHSSKGVIAIKEVHTQAVEKLRGTLDDDRIRIALLPDMYPMGEERAVIREVTGTLLGVDTLPLDADAIVVNAETVCRIEEAVDLKKPLIDKDMTVAGKLKGNTDLIRIFENVPIGISVQDVFDMAGGFADGYGEIIMGGPFTGKRVQPDDPVIKTTGGLIAAECFMEGPEKLGLPVYHCTDGALRAVNHKLIRKIHT